MSATTALDGLLDPLSGWLDAESARRVVELRVAPPVQQRIDTLAERTNDGVLTSDESAEYEALIDAADFISILKVKARQHLRPICTCPVQPAVASTACSATLQASGAAEPSKPFPITSSFLNHFSHLGANRIGRVLPW